MRHGSLFSGIGGFDLAAEWMGWENIFQVEIDEYCQKVLAKNFPNIKRYGDIKEFKGEAGSVDILTGGFPCQPFSTASHGIHVAEDLSNEMVRVVDEIRPRFAVGENVQREIIEKVAGEFKHIGYSTTIICLSASNVGADHKRNRWWVIAHTHDESKFFSAVDAETSKLRQIQNDTWGWENYAGVLRVPNGLPNRVDRLKGLGNAIVPQVAYEIFKIINTHYYERTRIY